MLPSVIINMAESNGDNNGHRRFIRSHSDSKPNESDDSDDNSEKESMSRPDIGLGNSKSIHGRKVSHDNSRLAGYKCYFLI